MIFQKSSKRMLIYEKVKSKLFELEISKEDYPEFTLNSDDLIYTTIYVLSRYCEEVIENNNSEKIHELYEELYTVSQYYDYAVKHGSRKYSNVFLLIGATAYFLSKNFGSSKVLINKIHVSSNENHICMLLYEIFLFIFNNKEVDIKKYNEKYHMYISEFQKYFNNGGDFKNIFNAIERIKNIVYHNNDDIYDMTCIDFLYAVTICALEHSAWKILNEYSEFNKDELKNIIRENKDIKILWPAQKLIVESGALLGKNLVIPLPTGVGKTKSIELILRSFFVKYDNAIAVIVAPLRALCNEIMLNLAYSFKNNIEVNQFTDVLQEDFDLQISSDKKYVFISTPEKLSYIARHNDNFLNNIKLFIFDESHLFDDDTRGPQYELLISEIARKRSSDSQMLLFSAVLSNAGQISEWLFKNSEFTINHNLIKSTEKSIAFWASDKKLHYFETNNIEKESFYIPKSVRKVELKNFGREKKLRIFPEENPNDIAIYYAINLCKRGGVAIFVGRLTSINTIMKRIIEIINRGYNIDNLKENVNFEEIGKLKNLILAHYGNNDPLTQAAENGVFSHFAQLPSGIKLSTEYALKNKYIKFVVCTSTLAEGVNIPIKYLFLTTFTEGESYIKIRKLHNLIGRTARSGMYTEGSVIITNKQYFDIKESSYYKDIYKWNNYKNMLNADNAEPCISSILCVVDSIKYYNKIILDRNDVIECIIYCYTKYKTCNNLIGVIIDKYKTNNRTLFIDEKYEDSIKDVVDKIKITINNIESYLCYIYNFNSNIFYDEVKKLIQLTFVFYLASDEQKEKLNLIFNCIAKNIVNTINEKNIIYFAKSLYGIEASNKIFTWINSNINKLEHCDENEMLVKFVDLFMDIIYQKNDISKDIFLSILKEWICGSVYIDIYENINKNIDFNKLQRVCSNVISYDFCFMLGNVIDAISDDHELLKNTISLLQKRVKYGTCNYFQSFICENIFDERYLARIINDRIEYNEKDDSIEVIIDKIKNKKNEIFKILDNYPKYFTYKFNMFLEHEFI